MTSSMYLMLTKPTSAFDTGAESRILDLEVDWRT
jgi:hypothetical protein